ncbi:MAG: tRNA glutamyl-Q(34) synthetase GluQRS, partial [Eggerthellaceae bacterium]|nr:tRNA glutamyl-Q(34) synthetase GluQRS [Eggerthellaceae bacterium]
MNDNSHITRLAPSPTGRMHAGNIYASLLSWLMGKKYGGKVCLRIEDIDTERSRPEYITQILSDYEKLGITWDGEVLYQSKRSDIYEEAIQKLADQNLVYPCFCTRADLHAASAPHIGEKTVYPGTCKTLSKQEIDLRLKTQSASCRLKTENIEISFEDMFYGAYSQNLKTDCGDFVIKRSDGLYAYQLAVVIDDACQGVDCVVRGVDLITSTPQQMHLQSILGYKSPYYCH